MTSPVWDLLSLEHTKRYLVREAEYRGLMFWGVIWAGGADLKSHQQVYTRL